MHEKSLYEDNLFVTLTYDPENLPEGGSLVKRDLQLFMKRLRKKHKKVRFYACGEYGETFGRPHYHLILFNCFFSDSKFFSKNGRGEALYTSDELSRIWPHGHNVFGEVTFDSAAYVARYIMKKVTGPLAQDHYDVVLPDGEICSRVPEFTNMSRKPGIGKGWYEKYAKECYTHDSVIMNGKQIRPPRFYDTLYEVVDSDKLSALKKKRRRKALKHRDDNTPERRAVREVVQLKRLGMGKRGIA